MASAVRADTGLHSVLSLPPLILSVMFLCTSHIRRSINIVRSTIRQPTVVYLLMLMLYISSGLMV